MRTYIAIPTLLAVSLALSACASKPNPNLEQARQNVVALQADPHASQLAPLETRDAVSVLERADKAKRDGAKDREVDHLAYLVNQRVALANQTISLKSSEQQLADASNQRAQARLDARDAQLRNQEEKIRQLQDELNAKPTERGTVVTFGDVLFDLNKADLKSGAAVNIQNLANFLRDNPERKVLVEGFTDSTGSDAYNLNLSQQRADSVRHALVRQGVESSRITTVGLGKAHPVADNNTPASRAMNRRVEVTISNDANLVPPRR